VFAELSRYHSPGWSSSSKAFSTYIGSLLLPSEAGPTRFAVRPGIPGMVTRRVELSQQGCAMVIAVSVIAATGHRGSVHSPRPPVRRFQYPSPPV
jgi:hypothetical protein